LRPATKEYVKQQNKECGPKNGGIRTVNVQNEVAYHREVATAGTVKDTKI